MVMLDDRARQAAQAIHDSAAGHTPGAPFPVVVRRHRRLQAAQGALAFAAVIGFIVLGALLRPAPPEDEVADDPPTIDEPPVVVDDVPEPEATVPDVVPDLETPFDPTDPGPGEEAPDADGARDAEPPEPPIEEPVDVTPPPLTITSPADGARFDVTTISFEGTTEPGADVAAGRWQADVDASGRWAISRAPWMRL